MIDILRDEISINEKFRKNIKLTDEIESKCFENHYYRFYKQNDNEIAMISEFVLEDITQEHMEEIQSICEELYEEYSEKVNVYLLEVDCHLTMRNDWKKPTKAEFEVNLFRC